MQAIIIIIVLFLGTLPGPALASESGGAKICYPPLPPEGIRVVSPNPALPPDIRSFSGSWSGIWIDPQHPQSGIREILVVEEIVSEDEIKVILSWGDCPVCHSKADCRRFAGKIRNLCIDWQKLPKPFYHIKTDSLGEKRVLVFGYPEGRVFTFVLDDEGNLIGTDGGGIIVMSRLN